ncbi:MAG: RsmB/NOP family class I SAM-dependent RNA methyltransferase [Desulfurococcaceae archaeon]
MNVNPLKAKLYIGFLLENIQSSKVSFEKAFSDIVKRYGLKSWEANQLYKLAYRVLIYYHSIRFLAGFKGYKPRSSQIVEILYRYGFNVQRILDELHDITKHLPIQSRIAILHGYPTWFVSDLHGRMPVDELESMLSSLNTRKRWLIVNTHKATLEDAIACLEEFGISTQKHPLFENVLQVKDPFKKLGNIPCITRGEVIPQDISSFIIVQLLKAYGEDLVDACSAPGLKLSEIANEKVYSRIVAVDISEARTGYIPIQLERIAGIIPTVIIVNSDSRTLMLNTKRATVFIDAPCSNSGSVYSNPAVKVYLSKRLVKKMSKVQLSLLKASAKYAERIVYAVCSVHPREGEEVVSQILSILKGFELSKVSLPYGNDGYRGYAVSKLVTRLNPHVVNGQGFFIAVLERR